MASDFDAWYPEFDVFVDVGGVSGTTLDFEGNQSMDIDLSVTPLCGNPVGWVLADDFSLQDGAFGLEVLADAGDVSCPSALSTTDRWKEILTIKWGFISLGKKSGQSPSVC